MNVKAKLADLEISDVYDMEQRIAWQAMIITMEAVIKFAHRYADLAEKQAAECRDPKRKEELLTMAENCRIVPGKSSDNIPAGYTVSMVQSSGDLY